MKIIDLENQSLVGMVLVIDAVVSELLVPYLKALPSDQRQAAIARISDQVAANGKSVVDLAPKVQLANAQKIQAASARIVQAAMADALAEIGKT